MASRRWCSASWRRWRRSARGGCAAARPSGGAARLQEEKESLIKELGDRLGRHTRCVPSPTAAVEGKRVGLRTLSLFAYSSRPMWHWPAPTCFSPSPGLKPSLPSLLGKSDRAPLAPVLSCACDLCRGAGPVGGGAAAAGDRVSAGHCAAPAGRVFPAPAAHPGPRGASPKHSESLPPWPASLVTCPIPACKPVL